MRAALRSDIARRNNDKFLFFVDTDFSGTMSHTKAGVRINLELSSGAGQTFFPVNFGKVPLNIAPSGHLKVDTFAGDYSVKLACKFAQWRLLDAHHAGFGFEMMWKASSFDSVRIFADARVTVPISGVNVTFSNFMLGAEGLAASMNPLDWTLLGRTNISLGKASTYIPGLPSPFGDAAIAEFANTTLELRLRQIYIRLKTTAKVVGREVGGAEIDLGQGIRYSNVILGMTDVESWGMRASVNPRIRFNVLNISLNAEGTAELSILNTFIGIALQGAINARINLWVVRPNIDIGGMMTAGVVLQRNGALQFVLAGRGAGARANAFELRWASGRGGGF